MEKPYTKRVWLFLCRIFSVIAPLLAPLLAPVSHPVSHQLLAQLIAPVSHPVSHQLLAPHLRQPLRQPLCQNKIEILAQLCREKLAMAAVSSTQAYDSEYIYLDNTNTNNDDASQVRKYDDCDMMLNESDDNSSVYSCSDDDDDDKKYVKTASEIIKYYNLKNKNKIVVYNWENCTHDDYDEFGPISNTWDLYLYIQDIYTHKITILNYQWADSYHQGYSSLSNRIINHNHEYNHLYEFLPLKYKISELLQPKLTIDIINCISSYLK